MAALLNASLLKDKNNCKQWSLILPQQKAEAALCKLDLVADVDKMSHQLQQLNDVGERQYKQ